MFSVNESLFFQSTKIGKPGIPGINGFDVSDVQTDHEYVKFYLANNYKFL